MIDPVKDAPVGARVPQLNGLDEKVPTSFPAEIMIELSLALQPVNAVRIRDGPVPPPDFLNGGEKLILVEYAQLTDPGPSPLKIGAAFAAAVVIGTMSSAKPKTNAKVIGQ